MGLVSPPTKVMSAIKIPINFKEKKLHVGYRHRDWTPVWYEPILTSGEGDLAGSERKADGTYMMRLYSEAKHKGPKEVWHPGPKEVLWNHHFHVLYCEADGKPAKEKLQREILYDAWRYCMATDPHQVRQLEEELRHPGFTRWLSWFESAKKWKWAQLKTKRSRRKTRASSLDAARVAGATEEEIESMLLESSDDSAYESDEEERAERARAAKKPRRDMPPPPPPRSTQGRQRGDRWTGPRSGAPRKQPGPGKKAGGARSIGLPSSKRTIVHDTDDEEDDDDDATTVDFDPRPPEGPSRAPSTNAANTGPPNDYDGRDYLMGSLDTPGAPSRPTAASIQGLFVTQSPSRNGNDAPPRSFRAGSVLREDDLMNGGVDEDEAVERAMRESMQRDEEDLAIQRAMSASVAPESRESGENGERGGERGESGVGDDSGVGLE